MESEDGTQCDAFAGSGFTDQGDDFTASDLQVDPIDRTHGFSACCKGDIQVFDVDQDVVFFVSTHLMPHAVASSVSSLIL